MSTWTTMTTPELMPDGKRRLIDAAVRLAAEGRQLEAIGLRELGREAGLNPNTFYRHFADMDALALEIARQVRGQLMTGMGEIRRKATTDEDAAEGVARYFASFVKDNKEVLEIGLREMYGGSPTMRALMREALDDIARESVQQLTTNDMDAALREDDLFQVTRMITSYMFHSARELIDSPEDEEAIVQSIIRFTRALFVGTAVTLPA